MLRYAANCAFERMGHSEFRSRLFRLGDHVEVARASVGEEDLKLLQGFVTGLVLVLDEFGVVVARIDEAVAMHECFSTRRWAHHLVMLPVDGCSHDFIKQVVDKLAGAGFIDGCRDVYGERELAGIVLRVGCMGAMSARKEEAEQQDNGCEVFHARFLRRLWYCETNEERAGGASRCGRGRPHDSRPGGRRYVGYRCLQDRLVTVQTAPQQRGGPRSSHRALSTVNYLLRTVNCSDH